MSLLPIDYVVAYYGETAWRDITIRWNGTGTDWVLYRIGEDIPLYEGTGRQFFYVGDPSTNYEFKVTTVVDGKDYEYAIYTQTTALPAPVGVRPTAVSDSAAALSWTESSGVDSYEIGDVKDSYRTLGDTKSTSFTLTGLDASTRYSYAVRSVYKSLRSRWSSPATFFTRQPDHILPGAYEFAPQSTYTWRAGRPGSTDPSWGPAQANWYHGDGFEWGDPNGVQTTYFFFGTPNPFNRLYGAVVTKCEVYVSRFATGGDPGAVLSRIGLHRYVSKPDGQPSNTGASVDAGSLTRGEGMWVEVPTTWGDSLITGAYAVGWYWGDCLERFEMAKNVGSDITPRIGLVRITVG